MSHSKTVLNSSSKSELKFKRSAEDIKKIWDQMYDWRVASQCNDEENHQMLMFSLLSKHLYFLFKKKNARCDEAESECETLHLRLAEEMRMKSEFQTENDDLRKAKSAMEKSSKEMSRQMIAVNQRKHKNTEGSREVWKNIPEICSPVIQDHGLLSKIEKMMPYVEMAYEIRSKRLSDEIAESEEKKKSRIQLQVTPKKCADDVLVFETLLPEDDIQPKKSGMVILETSGFQSPEPDATQLQSLELTPTHGELGKSLIFPKSPILISSNRANKRLFNASKENIYSSENNVNEQLSPSILRSATSIAVKPTSDRFSLEKSPESNSFKPPLELVQPGSSSLLSQSSKQSQSVAPTITTNTSQDIPVKPAHPDKSSKPNLSKLSIKASKSSTSSEKPNTASTSSPVKEAIKPRVVTTYAGGQGVLEVTPVDKSVKLPKLRQTKLTKSMFQQSKRRAPSETLITYVDDPEQLQKAIQESIKDKMQEEIYIVSPSPERTETKTNLRPTLLDETFWDLEEQKTNKSILSVPKSIHLNENTNLSEEIEQTYWDGADQSERSSLNPQRNKDCEIPDDTNTKCSLLDDLLTSPPKKQENLKLHPVPLFKNRAADEASKEPNFNFKGPPVRKKQDRMKLPGWDCDECSKYYAVAGQGMTDEELQARKNMCSRHRDKNPVRNDTPPGFWDPGFIETQNNTTQCGELRPRRKGPNRLRLKVPTQNSNCSSNIS